MGRTKHSETSGKFLLLQDCSIERNSSNHKLAWNYLVFYSESRVGLREQQRSPALLFNWTWPPAVLQMVWLDNLAKFERFSLIWLVLSPSNDCIFSSVVCFFVFHGGKTRDRKINFSIRVISPEWMRVKHLDIIFFLFASRLENLPSEVWSKGGANFEEARIVLISAKALSALDWFWRNHYRIVPQQSKALNAGKAKSLFRWERKPALVCSMPMPPRSVHLLS